MHASAARPTAQCCSTVLGAGIGMRTLLLLEPPQSPSISEAKDQMPEVGMMDAHARYSAAWHPQETCQQCQRLQQAFASCV